MTISRATRDVETIVRPDDQGRRTLVIATVCVWALAASGCLGLQAKAVTVLQPLDVPVPPPHVVEVRNPEPLPMVPMPAADEPARSAPPPRQAQQPVPSPRPAEPAKVEPAAPDTAKAPDEGTRTGTTLQTTTSQQEGEVERRVRAQLAQATGDLARINYQGLNADARTQYDTAKRFVSQAEEAVRAKNLVFASNLAEKAAALASQLAGR